MKKENKAGEEKKASGDDFLTTPLQAPPGRDERDKTQKKDRKLQIDGKTGGSLTSTKATDGPAKAPTNSPSEPAISEPHRAEPAVFDSSIKKAAGALLTTLLVILILVSFNYVEAIPSLAIHDIDSSLAGRMVETSGYVKSYYSREGRFTIILRESTSESHAEDTGNSTGNSTIRVVVPERISARLGNTLKEIKTGSFLKVRGRVSEYKGVCSIEVTSSDGITIERDSGYPDIFDLATAPYLYTDRQVVLTGTTSEKEAVRDSSVRIVWDGEEELFVRVEYGAGSSFPINAVVSVAGVVEYSSVNSRMEVKVRSNTEDFIKAGSLEPPSGYAQVSVEEVKDLEEGTKVFLNGLNLRSNYELKGTSFMMHIRSGNTTYTVRGMALVSDFSMDHNGNRVNTTSVVSVEGLFRYSPQWVSYYVETKDGWFEVIG